MAQILCRAVHAQAVVEGGEGFAGIEHVGNDCCNARHICVEKGFSFSIAFSLEKCLLAVAAEQDEFCIHPVKRDTLLGREH